MVLWKKWNLQSCEFFLPNSCFILHSWSFKELSSNLITSFGKGGYVVSVRLLIYSTQFFSSTVAFGRRRHMVVAMFVSFIDVKNSISVWTRWYIVWRLKGPHFKCSLTCLLTDDKIYHNLSLNFYFICIHITLPFITRHDKTSIHTNGIQKKVFLLF